MHSRAGSGSCAQCVPKQRTRSRLGQVARLEVLSRTVREALGLQQELEDRIAGEVRFDRVSRALYSTDASVYRMEPAGVVVPRTREDVVRTVEIAARQGKVEIIRRGNSRGGIQELKFRSRQISFPQHPGWGVIWQEKIENTGGVVGLLLLIEIELTDLIEINS